MINGPRVATSRQGPRAILPPMALAFKNHTISPRIRVSQGWLGPSWSLRCSRRSPELELLPFLRYPQFYSGL